MINIKDVFELTAKLNKLCLRLELMNEEPSIGILFQYLYVPENRPRIIPKRSLVKFRDYQCNI